MKTFLSLIIVSVFFVILGYTAYLGYENLLVNWNSLSNEWKPLIVIFATIMFVCTLILSFSLRKSFRTSGVAGTGKVLAFNAFVDWYSALKNDIPDAINMEVFNPVKNQILLWGGNNVVRQMQMLFDEISKTNCDKAQLTRYADNVYLEIRRELGHRNPGIDRAIT